MCVLHLNNALELLASFDSPLGEPTLLTHSYGNLPYNIEIALGLPPSCKPPLGEPTNTGTSLTTLRMPSGYRPHVTFP